MLTALTIAACTVREVGVLSIHVRPDTDDSKGKQSGRQDQLVDTTLALDGMGYEE